MRKTRPKRDKWSTNWSEQKSKYRSDLEKIYSMIERKIAKNPRKSIRGISRDLKMPYPTVQRIIKEKLKYSSRVRRKIPLLSQATRQKRVERCRNILSILKHKMKEKVMIFSDEKNFTMDWRENRINSRYLTQFRVKDVHRQCATNHTRRIRAR